MERPYILHMFTPGRQLSPFDVNMAADAGWQVLAPYCDVALDHIAALTQDTIFSRGPKGLTRTAIFIGGRDALLAAAMLDRARAAMLGPFAVSLMADPSGAYTTAAALLACVEAALRDQHAGTLQGQRVLILGGTGPVGRIAGVIAAQAGASVQLASRGGALVAERTALETAQRFGVTLHGQSSADPAALQAALAQADVLLACAAAGVQVVSAAELAAAGQIRVAADLNAVPPQGIAGVAVMDDGKMLAGLPTVAIGALAVGNVKYQTQNRLLAQMQQSDQALVLSFGEAFAMARQVLAEKRAQSAA